MIAQVLLNELRKIYTEETAQERCYFQWGVFNVGKREYIWEDHENENVCFGTSNRLEANASKK